MADWDDVPIQPYQAYYQEKGPRRHLEMANEDWWDFLVFNWTLVFSQNQARLLAKKSHFHIAARFSYRLIFE